MNACGLGSRPQPGQGPGQGPGGNSTRFLQRFDHNRDGKVSRAEFDGPPRRFRILDRNGDGSLSGDELQQGNRPGATRELPGNRRGPGAAATQRPARQLEATASSGIETSIDAADTEKDVRADAAWNELPPSFVFILSDDQGWTGLSVQMHDAVPGSKSDFYRTPNLERLASQGMRFSCAYSPAANCSPTRASLLTDRSPAKLHITDVPHGQSPGAANTSRPTNTRLLSHQRTLLGTLLQGVRSCRG